MTASRLVEETFVAYKGSSETERGTHSLSSFASGSIRGQVLQCGKGYLVPSFLEPETGGRDDLLGGSCLSPPLLPSPWCETGHVFCDHPLL